MAKKRARKPKRRGAYWLFEQPGFDACCLHIYESGGFRSRIVMSLPVHHATPENWIELLESAPFKIEVLLGVKTPALGDPKFVRWCDSWDIKYCIIDMEGDGTIMKLD